MPATVEQVRSLYDTLSKGTSRKGTAGETLFRINRGVITTAREIHRAPDSETTIIIACRRLSTTPSANVPALLHHIHAHFMVEYRSAAWRPPGEYLLVAHLGQERSARLARPSALPKSTLQRSEGTATGVARRKNPQLRWVTGFSASPGFVRQAQGTR